MRYLFLGLSLLLCAALPAQKKHMKVLDKPNFLREILGAKYSKSDRIWALPRTDATRDTFGVEANGGLFVEVDTLFTREVGGLKEAWVLFLVEGYIFNFARMGQSASGWEIKKMHYRLHEGAPGEYAPLDFDAVMIGKKTFLSIQEDWYGGGIIRTNWLLFDPLTGREAGKIELARTGEKEQNPQAFTEILCLQQRFEPTKAAPLPDIVLSQSVDQKKKGATARLSTRTLRYRWDDKKGIYAPLR
jgi:hypothetical protein